MSTYSSSFAPALSVLPRLCYDDIVLNQRKELAKKGIDLDLTTMQLLDALAAVCVLNPDDVFATAVDVYPHAITVSLASSHETGVPDSAIRHLDAIWAHLQAASRHPDSVRLRTEPTFPPALLDFHRPLVAAQFRYSWPAWISRVEHDAKAVIGILERVILNYQFSRAELANSVNFSDGVFSAAQQTFLQDTLKHLHGIVCFVDSNRHEDKDLFDLYISLEKLEKHYSVVQHELELQFAIRNISQATYMPVHYHLQRFMWFVTPLRCLINFAHSSKFSDWKVFRVIFSSTAPQRRELQADPLDSNLWSVARQPYTGIFGDVSPQFDEEFHTYVVGHLNTAFAHVRQSPGSTAQVKLFDVQIHPACALLSLKHQSTRLAVYIGTSELCCFPCSEFFKAHNEICSGTSVYVRGTHGLSFSAWAPPQLSCPVNGGVLARLQSKLERRFAKAFDMLYVRLRAAAE